MENESQLEDLMPEEEIPPRENVASDVSLIKPLNYEQKDMIVSLFDDLSIAHEKWGPVAGTMSSLCKVLDPDQLLMVMKCSVHPLI